MLHTASCCRNVPRGVRVSHTNPTRAIPPASATNSGPQPQRVLARFGPCAAASERIGGGALRGCLRVAAADDITPQVSAPMAAMATPHQATRIPRSARAPDHPCPSRRAAERPLVTTRALAAELPCWLPRMRRQLCALSVTSSCEVPAPPLRVRREHDSRVRVLLGAGGGAREHPHSPTCAHGHGRGHSQWRLRPESPHRCRQSRGSPLPQRWPDRQQPVPGCATRHSRRLPCKVSRSSQPCRCCYGLRETVDLLL